ncbi:MAG: T9SS type A sorting domain-containing protein [Cyclobacteriaceae bacterium]
MKTWLTIILVCTGVWCCAQTVSRAEYFFDTDPGPGNGTPISIVASDLITFTETIPTTGLEPGYHQLYVRTKTSNGNWSLFEPREFIIDGGIIAAEYFFDTDPGIGNGTPLSITPITSTITPTISTASLPDGEHYLFVRTRHDDDVWSLSDPVYFIIQTRIVEAEYFIDLDPGFGNGTPLSISTPSDLITITPTITTPVVADGNHYLFVRTRDILGKWSHYEPLVFTVDSALPVELYDFIATAMRDGRVKLQWTTATELNNDYFTLEHSAPGLEFNQLFDVAGAGTTTRTTHYEEIHETPVAGINYYRLKQTDFDGSYTYSKIVSADVTKTTTVYPNPVRGNWFVEFSESNTEGRRLEIFDITGKKIMEHVTQQSRVELTREGIISGTYILRITAPGKRPEMLKITFL